MLEVNNLGFKEETLQIINYMSDSFLELSEKEGDKTLLSEWINDNISSVEGNFFKGWTDREKYLYSLGTVSAMLSKEFEKHLKEAEYVKQLERLVIFLADIYTKTTKITENELIENKNDIHCKIPLIQGLKNQLAINKIASLKETLNDEDDNVKYNLNLDSIVKSMKERVELK